VSEAKVAAVGAEEEVAGAPAVRTGEEAEAVAPAAGVGERVEAVCAQEEQGGGGAHETEVEVAKAAGGVGAVWMLRQRHRHGSGGDEVMGAGRSPVLVQSIPPIYLGFFRRTPCLSSRKRIISGVTDYRYAGIH